MSMPGLTPRQVFEDNLRPAELLLSVYTLLDCDKTYTEHEMLDALRSSLKLPTDESLLLLYNQLFVGIIRERAYMPQSTFKRGMLDNILRQSVSSACTALDAFLPSLLRANLNTIIKIKSNNFFPSDSETKSFFEGVKFDMNDAVRIMEDPDPMLYIENKIIASITTKGAGHSTALHAIGTILDIVDPWKQIRERIGAPDARKTLDQTVARRNDIIHRADRSKTDLDGLVQEISYAWTNQAVDNVKNVCIALDELVAQRMQTLLAATAP